MRISFSPAFRGIPKKGPFAAITGTGLPAESFAVHPPSLARLATTTAGLAVRARKATRLVVSRYPSMVTSGLENSPGSSAASPGQARTDASPDQSDRDAIRAPSLPKSERELPAERAGPAMTRTLPGAKTLGRARAFSRTEPSGPE